MPLDGLNKTIFQKIVMIYNPDREVCFKCKQFHAKSKIEDMYFKCNEIVKLSSSEKKFKKTLYCLEMKK